METKKNSLYITGYNSEVVNPSTAIAKSFDVQNKSPQDVLCDHIILKYKSGLEEALIDLNTKHLGNDADLFIEPLELCVIGTPKNSQFIQVFRFNPFRWGRSTNVEVLLGTGSGETINPRDVSITFGCKY